MSRSRPRYFTRKDQVPTSQSFGAPIPFTDEVRPYHLTQRRDKLDQGASILTGRLLRDAEYGIRLTRRTIVDPITKISTDKMVRVATRTYDPRTIRDAEGRHVSGRAEYINVYRPITPGSRHHLNILCGKD